MRIDRQAGQTKLKFSFSSKKRLRKNWGHSLDVGVLRLPSFSGTIGSNNGV